MDKKIKIDHRGVYKSKDKYWFGLTRVEKPDPITDIFSRTTVTETCWIYKDKSSNLYNGYGRIRFNKKSIAVHRFIYETFYGPIDKNLVCCHKCDVRNCINPAHIFIGTREENQKDMRDKGRAAKGSRNGYSKLTEEDIPKIRHLYNDGLTQKEIGKMYGVSQTVLGKVVRGITWRHVK